jgi:hypothetical protein
LTDIQEALGMTENIGEIQNKKITQVFQEELFKFLTRKKRLQ